MPDAPLVRGWYRDPDNPRKHRYWNGHEWVYPHDSEDESEE